MTAPALSQAAPNSGAGYPPIRVAHLIHTMAHGGVETALLNWCRTLDRTLVEPHLICFANPGASEQPFVEAARSLGFPVTLVKWDRTKPVLRASRQVAAYLREHQCNLLHCHNTYANATGLLAARFFRVKTMTTLYVWGKFGWKREALQRLDQLLMKGFDLVSAHCESCFQDTVARGIPASRLELLVCGYPASPAVLSHADRVAKRESFGAEESDKVLIFMARFWPEKAHDNLLKGFRLLLEQHPAARLWLPGTGPELERIRALCTHMGLDARVNFLGFQKDPDGLLAAADMQVHPSDNEGVALAICAGMSTGLPIVASRVGGLPEVLKDGENAILIPPRDPHAFAAAVGRLLDHPEEATRLGNNAREFIAKRYSLQAATRKLESVYRSLLGI